MVAIDSKVPISLSKCDVPMSKIASENRLLLSTGEAAEVCGVSLRTWRSWDAAGLVPAPLRIGRSCFWRTAELRAWVNAGCPRRDRWNYTAAVRR